MHNPSPELIALAIEIADYATNQRVVHEARRALVDGEHWLDTGTENCTQSFVYLTLRNKLERHPTKPNLVRIKE